MPEGVAVPTSAEGPALTPQPPDEEHMARLNHYRAIITAQEAQWRANGHSEDDVTRLRGELMRSTLGE
ncbi:MAG TPA: hypothetical protein VGQ83_14255 [Polyangia bacterium]